MAKVGLIKKQKFLLIGFGLHGGGRSVFHFLKKRGAKIRVTDIKTRKQLSKSLHGLGKIAGTFGTQKKSDVIWADVCIKNPGVPTSNTLLQYAKKLHKPILSDLDLFQEEIDKKIDCIVTGTRGKTTTTELIGHILRWAGFPTVVAGNNRIPALTLVQRAKKSRVILEASSFQIEDSSLHSKVSVFTTFYRDHMNRYSSLSHYFAAKSKVIVTQMKTDFAVLNYDDRRIRELAKKTKAQVLFFSVQMLPKGRNGSYKKRDTLYLRIGKKDHFIAKKSNLKLPGTHNEQNILAAVAAAYVCGAPIVKIRKAISQFSGVPYRLEKIRTYKKRVFYNDTTATSPDAFVAAYKTIRELHPTAVIRCIIGGSDKGLDFSQITKLPKDNKVILYPLRGSATKRFLAKTHFDTSKKIFTSLSQAVNQCWKDSGAGDVIILSPGAASFGMFTHEFDRGDQYADLIKRIK